jgi:hypothetical protein
LFYPVKNQTGSSIAKGTAVRFAGTVGASGRLLIAPFIADGSVSSSFFMGVTAEAIANGADGKVLYFGRIRGINTNAFNEGDVLYASTTVAGGFQTAVPLAPNNIVQVAAVINKSINQGVIFIRPSFGSNINQDEGVKIVSPTTGQLLQLQANGLWENKTTAQVLGGTSSQFVKGDGTLDSNTYQVTSEKGEPNGYASLDSNGKVPLVQINDALIGNVNFQGLWNAATNTPTLANPPTSGTKGYYYIVSTAGTFASISFEVGDWIISDGTAWGKVDNTDAVSSVFGRTGNVTAANGDYTTAQVTESGNLYYTDGRARGALSFVAGSGAYNSTTGVITIPTNNNQITNGAGYITSAALSGYVQGSGSAGQVAFFNGTTSIGSEANLFWDSSNNRLGINNALPSEILHVVAGLNGGGILIESTGTERAPALKLYPKASSANERNWAISAYRDSQESLSISSSDSKGSDPYSNGTTRLIINGINGNVGIGTTSDAGFKLDVNGTGRFSGDLRVNVSSNKNISTFTPSSWNGINDFLTGGVGWQFTRPNGAFMHGIFSFDGSSTNNLAISSRSDVIIATDGGLSDSVERIRITAAGDLSFKGRSTTTNYDAGFYNDNSQFAINANNTNVGKTINFNVRNDQNAMTINSSGNVGIGNGFTPSWMLEINKDTSSGSFGQYPAISVNNPNASGFSAYYFFSGASNRGGFEYSNSSNDLLIFANGGERMRITSAGNVGIGTDSPQAILSSANTGALTLDSNDGNHTGFGLFIQAPSTINRVNSAIGFGQTSGRKLAAIAMQTYADSDQAGLNFYVQSTASGSIASLTEAMRITSAGNVGIGTTTPGSLLTLALSESIGTYFEGGGTPNSAFARRLKISASTTTNFGDTHTIDAISSSGVIALATTSTERMRITSGGNVLIGTTTDSGFKLDVNGTAAFGLVGNVIFTKPNGSSYTRFLYSGSNVNVVFTGGTSANNGAFGINNFEDSVRIFNILNSGEATFSSLSGSGNRIVVANSGGTLISAVIGSGLAFDGTTLTATGGASGSISGSGTSGTVALFTGSSSIGNSSITQSGNNITCSGSITSALFGVNALNAYGFTSYDGGSASGKSINFSTGYYGGLDAIFQSAGNTNDFAIWTNGGTSTQAKLYIKNAGNVLIGTSTDNGNKLRVNGDLWIDGVYRVPASSYFISGVNGFRFNNSTDAFNNFVILDNGNTTTRGSSTASSFFESSDATIKTLVEDAYQAKGIDSVVAKLYIKNGKQELGYYAQDLEGVLPSAVSKGSNGLLNLSYREVHTAKIAYLEQQIKELRNELVKPS